jgi:hypothetical protein
VVGQALGERQEAGRGDRCGPPATGSGNVLISPAASWTLPALVGGGLVLLVGLVSLARRGRRSWAWAASAFIFALLLSRFFGSAEASGSGGGATGEW